MRLIAALTVLALAACSAGVSDGITASGTAYRPPLGASDIGVGYVTLTSKTDDRITGVSSPLAKTIEIHTTVNVDGAMGMKRLDSVDLKAGEKVVFGPGGMHLMIFSPQPIKAGAATFPVEFKLESGKTKTVDLAAGTGGVAGH